MYRVKFNLKRMAEKLLLMSKCCQIIKIVFEKKPFLENKVVAKSVIVFAEELT